MYFCEFCGKGYNTPHGLGNHKKWCTKNPKYEQYQIERLAFPGRDHCKFCNKPFLTKSAIQQHELRCIKNPNGIEVHFDTSGNSFKEYREKYGSWSRGLTKETDERVAKAAAARKKRLADGLITPSFAGRHHTEETKQKIRAAVVAAGGNSNPHPNKNCKTGTYLGVHYDSSWELAFFVYYTEHGYGVQRNKQGFSYIFNNERHLYFPDFIIDGEYYEIKNYETDQVKAKIEQFPKNLILHVLYGKDLKNCLRYCKAKYGKNFWNILH